MTSSGLRRRTDAEPARNLPQPGLRRRRGICPQGPNHTDLSSAASLGDGSTSKRFAMTKQGSFKRAVRQLARESGQRYTEARAALEKGKSAERPRRPFEHAALKAHLEAHYGIRITSMAPIDDPGSRPRGSWDGHYPATLLVKREYGLPWVARIFSSPADQVSRVEGDADILRFLASHDFPAERIAHDVPVSVLNGSGVMVTQFVEGGRPTDAHGRVESPAVQHELAS